MPDNKLKRVGNSNCKIPNKQIKYFSENRKKIKCRSFPIETFLKVKHTYLQEVYLPYQNRWQRIVKTKKKNSNEKRETFIIHLSSFQKQIMSRSKNTRIVSFLPVAVPQELYLLKHD